MQYIYHQDSGQNQVIVEGELHKYLFKVRRSTTDDVLYLRNLNDSNLYEYSIISIDKRKAILQLKTFQEKELYNAQPLHIGWCAIDPKNIEKVIPSLNEIGVQKITFIHCDYSQKNFKINLDRLEKILINSSQQCGRTQLMHLDVCKSLEDFLQNNDNVFCVDFTTKIASEDKLQNIKTIVLGCEGGFTQNERDLFNENQIIGFDTPTILRSETAAISIASKILL